MPSATPTQLGLTTADNGLVQKTAVGPWGWYGSDLVARSTALPDLVGVGSALLGVGAGAVRGGAVRVGLVS